MSSRAYVYVIPDELLSVDVDQLEVLVTVFDDDDEHAPPEVAVRPTIEGVPLRIWGAPLELVRQT